MLSISKNFILGIDIGTTSVKISLLDINKKEIIATNGMKYNFNNANNNDDNESKALPPNYSQQNVQTIISCIQQTLSGIDRQMRQNIGLISICGQMHGCVLWNKNSFWKYNNESFDFTINSSLVSDLYGWQDNRCSPQFISTLPKPDSYVDYISSGFGCATIFWLQRNSPDFIKLFSNSGTIMDFLVCILCDLEVPLISTHNATSYGYFDPIAHCWNTNILKSNDFPIHLLPEVKKTGTIAGFTKLNWLSIESNTPVMVAFGDMQCSCFANLKNSKNTAVLSISTSMQLSLLMPKDYIPTKKSESQNKSIDYFPYFENRYLSVAASLNGGNVLQSFVKTLKSITQQISDVNVSEEKIWDKLLESSENLKSEEKDSDNNKVLVKATLFGERHDTNLKASIINISDSLELNEIFGAICSGLIDNIFEMMSITFLEEAGIQRLIGTGTALLRNPILKHVLERKLNIPVIYIDGNDADVGSAWVAFAYYYKSLHLLNDNFTQY